MSKFYVVSLPMRIIISLVYLCSLLFAGHFDSNAGVINDGVLHLNSHYSGFKFSGSATSEKDERLVATDDVQDDDDNSVVRRYKLPVKYDFTTSHRFFLNYFHRSYSSGCSFCNRGVRRFLILRTLRI